MSSAGHSESDTEFGNDWLQQPIKSRSYYNSRFCNVMLLRQKSMPLDRNESKSSSGTSTPSTSPTPSTDAGDAPSTSSQPRRSLLPTPSAAGVGMIPPVSSSSSMQAKCMPKGVARCKVTPTATISEPRPYRKCIEISSQDIGAILGRAGSTVSRVEHQYNVTVYLDRQRLLLIVRGRLQVQVNDALVDICKIIADNRNRSAGGCWSSMPQMARQTAAASHKNSNSNNKSWRSTSTFPGISTKKFPFPAREFTFKYRESAEVAALSESAALALRATNHIRLVYNDCEGFGFNWPRPIWLFEQAFAQYGNNWAHILQQRFGRPTAIQAQGWPILLQGHDLIGVARSGMGKTLTYLLPTLLHTQRQMRLTGPAASVGAEVLILVPTQEAAIQVDIEKQNFSNGQIHSLLLVDGTTNRFSQLDQRIHWIIGTPRRIADLLDDKDLNLSDISLFVVDGGHRFLEMGLEPHLYRIAQSMRLDRQSIIMSISWNAQVHRLANRLTLRPVLVCIGPQAEPKRRIAAHSESANIVVRQLVCVLQEHEKFNKLMGFLGQMTLYDRTIIYCSSKERATDLSNQLTINKLSNTCLHGLLEHEERWQILSDISRGFVRILIATDLVSHGLDIEDVTHVINYDFPPDMADYVLRVDRTGRSGRLGTCISFITGTDGSRATQLISILEAGLHQVPIELRHMAQRFNQSRQKRRTASASSCVRHTQSDGHSGLTGD